MISETLQSMREGMLSIHGVESLLSGENFKWDSHFPLCVKVIADR